MKKPYMTVFACRKTEINDFIHFPFFFAESMRFICLTFLFVRADNANSTGQNDAEGIRMFEKKTKEEGPKKLAKRKSRKKFFITTGILVVLVTAGIIVLVIL